MKKYYPILLAKKGEVVALQHLKESVKNNICPIIQLVDDSFEKEKPTGGEKKRRVSKQHFTDILKKHWAFEENEIILDFSLLSEIDQKVPEIKKILISLLDSGINVAPTLQINSSSSLGKIIKDLAKSHSINVCWRTSDDSGGYDNFKTALDKFVPYIGIETRRISLLLDMGYAKNGRLNILKDLAKTSLKSLSKKIPDWNAVIFASSSFPENLGHLSVQSEPHRLPRNEWKIWRSLIADNELKGLKYGDYGTKSCEYTEANYAGTISVKYTLENEYLVFRGKLSNEHKDGHGQYITHAANLVRSEDYSGKDFSWGDEKIYDISKQQIDGENRTPGSSTTWVQISQNHHITLLENLL